MAKRRTTEAWRAVIDRFSGSGLSIDAYCKKFGICWASFLRWRSTFSRGATSVSSAEPALPSFVDLGPLRSSSARMELRLELGDGLVLTLTRG